MVQELAKPKRMPLWALVVIAFLYLVAGGAFGVGVGRDLTVSHPEWAAKLDTYIWPIFWVALLAPLGLIIWLNRRGAKNQMMKKETMGAVPGASADRPRE